MTDNNHNKEKPQRRQVPPWGMADEHRRFANMPTVPTQPDPSAVYRTGLTGGQILLGLFLCCFGLLPGLVYFVAASRETKPYVPASLEHNPLSVYYVPPTQRERAK